MKEKRTKFNTSVAPDTRKGLKQIAKREKLHDHRGYPSEGRAIDWLVDHHGCIVECQKQHLEHL